jgi:hypothetical protein
MWFSTTNDKRHVRLPDDFRHRDIFWQFPHYSPSGVAGWQAPGDPLSLSTPFFPFLGHCPARYACLLFNLIEDIYVFMAVIADDVDHCRGR